MSSGPTSSSDPSAPSPDDFAPFAAPDPGFQPDPSSPPYPATRYSATGSAYPYDQPVPTAPVAGLPRQPGGPSGYAGYGPGAPYGIPGPYPLVAVPRTNGLAIASMVISLVSLVLCLCGLLAAAMGTVGAVLGHVAHHQIVTRQEAGRGFAIAGIVIGWFGALVGLAWLVLAFVPFG